MDVGLHDAKPSIHFVKMLCRMVTVSAKVRKV
jgi:hypothetical protein